MRDRKIRVATFNCEWRPTRSADAALIRERVLKGQPDVVCLTEAYHDFFEGYGHTIEAMPHRSDRYAGRRKVLLWSREPWDSIDQQGAKDLPPGRFVSGCTHTPAGRLTAIGVCIPYRWTGRTDTPKLGVWEAHLRYLSALDSILAAEPRRTVVLGDFNQRVPRKYQPQRVYDALGRTLLSRMNIATAGVIPHIGTQAIDHICHSYDLIADRVLGLSNKDSSGREISDHFGLLSLLSPADGWPDQSDPQPESGGG